jgi:hypothetical protein
MAQKVNIVIDQGTTFNTDYTFTDEFNDPINFTTYTGRSQMRRSYMSSTSYAFTVGLTSIGVVSLAMSANTTSSIPAGRYLYDLEVEDQNGVVSRLVEGIVTVSPEVTK